MAKILAEIAQEMEDKISNALEIAASYGTTDGSSHKMWVIDQMVRALTGCPEELVTHTDYKGQPFEVITLVPNSEYREFVQELADDDYEWDEGIAP